MKNILSLNKFKKLHYTSTHVKSHTYPFIKEHSISKELEITTNLFPDNIGAIFHHQNKVMTWTEIFQKSQKIAANLLELGFKKGDKIGLYLPNCYEWYLCQMACTLADLIMVTINPAYKEVELEYCLQQTHINGLITSNLVKPHKVMTALEGLLKEEVVKSPFDLQISKFPHLKQIIVTQHDESLIDDKFLIFQKVLENSTPSTKNENIILENIVKQDPNSITNIQYTSGTTGLPKGVCLTHRNILNNGYFIADRIHFTSKDIICLPVPLYHCFGMVMGNLAALSVGASVLFSNYFFNSKKTMEAVEKYQATTLYGVPTMFIEYLKEQEAQPRKLTKLKKGIMAGSICPKLLLQRVKNELGMSDICVGYGMTETSPVSFMVKPEDNDDIKSSTVGSHQPNVETRIENQNGQLVKIGEEGELKIKGHQVMCGYYGNEEATKGVLKDGWMSSGDLVVMDKYGYLTVTGRSKDIIIRGGENIAPKEIEEYLLHLNGIENVQIIGVEDYKYGEEICALIKLKQGIQMQKEEILNFCKGKISHFKIPKYVKFVNELPITVTGKPQKFKMREEWKEHIKITDPSIYAIRQLYLKNYFKNQINLQYGQLQKQFHLAYFSFRLHFQFHNIDYIY